MNSTTPDVKFLRAQVNMVKTVSSFTPPASQRCPALSHQVVNPKYVECFIKSFALPAHITLKQRHLLLVIPTY